VQGTVQFCFCPSKDKLYDTHHCTFSGCGYQLFWRSYLCPLWTISCKGILCSIFHERKWAIWSGTYGSNSVVYFNVTKCWTLNMPCDIVLVSIYVNNCGDHSMVHCGINSHTKWNLLSKRLTTYLLLQPSLYDSSYVNTVSTGVWARLLNIYRSPVTFCIPWT